MSARVDDFSNHWPEIEHQHQALPLPSFPWAVSGTICCCGAGTCIKKLGWAKFLPGDGSFNQQKILSWLHLFQSSERHCSHLAAPLLWYPEPPRLSQRMLQHLPGAARCFGAGSPEQLQLVLFWSRMELNLEQVLRDQWCFPRVKPLYGKADYPRPAVTFCSRWQLLRGAGTSVCAFLSFYWALALTSPSAWGARRACYDFLSTLFFRSSVSSFKTTGLAPKTTFC